ncbi:hypothetical protein ACFE04_020038 [Oxalis oulophora]
MWLSVFPKRRIQGLNICSSDHHQIFQKSCCANGFLNAMIRQYPKIRLIDSFLVGTSSVYLEELQRAWEVDPTSVDESWDNVFRNFVGQASTLPGISGQTIQESMRLLVFVRAYQVNGHMKAKLDPLNLEDNVIPDDLDPLLYGFTDPDLESIRNIS